MDSGGYSPHILNFGVMIHARGAGSEVQSHALAPPWQFDI
jgi:hypothetical protein